jgi:cytochrome P450
MSLPKADQPGERTVGKVAFDPPILDGYATEILSGGKTRSIRVSERAARGVRVTFVAQPQDVTAALSNEAVFSVGHYTRLYAAIAPPGKRLLMHEPDSERTLRYEILRAAAAETAWFKPNAKPLRDEAKRCVGDLIQAFRARPTRTFDLITEFGSFAPYLLGCRILGLPGPRRWGLFPRLFCFLKGGFRVRPFRPETGAFLTQLTWSQLVFGQLFGNFERRNPVFNLLAPYAAKKLRAHIAGRLQAWAAGEGAQDASLLSVLCSDGFRKRWRDRLTPEAYDEEVLSLMLELMGTIQAIPGQAFATIVKRWIGGAGGLETGLADGLADMAHVDLDSFVMESLRLSPPAPYLLRRVVADGGCGDAAVAAGEYVCALAAHAGRDPASVPDPGEIRAGRPAEVYFHFGPEGGPHQCFGRYVARTLLGEMFVGLAALPGLKAVDKMRGLKIDDRLEVRFDKGPPRPAGPPPDATQRLAGIAAP